MNGTCPQPDDKTVGLQYRMFTFDFFGAVLSVAVHRGEGIHPRVIWRRYFPVALPLLQSCPVVHVKLSRYCHDIATILSPYCHHVVTICYPTSGSATISLAIAFLYH